MKKIIYISFLAILLAACGSNKSEVEKIQVEIPAALNDNKDAKELIEDMTDAVNTCRANMATGAKFAIEQEKSGSDSLTFKQGIKAAKFAAKMMFAAKKIEKVREEAELLKPELNEAEWLALETKLAELETSVGDLNPEDLGLSEEDIAKLKDEGGLQIGEEAMASEEQAVVEEELTTNPEDLEKGMALRELEQELMEQAHADSEAQQAENNNEGGSSWFVLPFIILVFVLIIFGVRRSARASKRKLINASETFRVVKNQFNNKK